LGFCRAAPCLTALEHRAGVAAAFFQMHHLVSDAIGGGVDASF
jgi:hypothetical protein